MGELFAGRYELVDPLGYGGMGAVWRCWDHKISRYVAAKLLRQVDAMSLLRFVREQAFRIDHPHVVTPLSWAAEDNRVLYTMPIVRGGSVATLRNDFGALPTRWVAVLVDQVLDALDAVHNAGVVHRDLKPANLLLEPTGRGRPHLRLSDFGIAAAVGEPRLTSPSHIVGTPGYVAPEQLRGAGPEPRQDLYAVGVVAADLLVGAVESASEPVAPSVSGPPPPGVGAAFWSLLGRLTAERPEDRPPNAAVARAELAAAGCLPERWPVGAPGHSDDAPVPTPHGPGRNGPGRNGPARNGPEQQGWAPGGPAQRGPAPAGRTPAGTATGAGSGAAASDEVADDVEVFDHHPALPPGWGANGRVGSPPGPVPIAGAAQHPTPPQPTPPQPTPTLRQAAESDAGTTTPTGPASTGPASTGPASTGPASTGPASTGPASTGPASTGPAGSGAPSAGPARGGSARPGRGRRVLRMLAWVTTAAGLALMATGAVLLMT